MYDAVVRAVSKPSVRAMWPPGVQSGCYSHGRLAVSKPSVRAMWPPGPAMTRIERSSACFKALGAGNVAPGEQPEDASWLARLVFQSPRCGQCGPRGDRASVQRRMHMFQSPRCGQCGPRGGTLQQSTVGHVSKPSVRAMWPPGVLPDDDSSGGTRFKALGAGNVAPGDAASDYQWTRRGRVSKPSVRAMWPPGHDRDDR